MTQNRRIALNILATYARSLYALALGLFTARWALEALGTVDYDLARRLAYRTCKIVALFILVFAIPLMLEIDEVLALWPKYCYHHF